MLLETYEPLVVKRLEGAWARFQPQHSIKEERSSDQGLHGMDVEL